jgi:hypothetical protein
MLYDATIIHKHCKEWNIHKKKHPHDHENKNVVSIHKSEYISVIVLGCLVKTTLCLALYIYYSPPLPPQTFKLLHLCCFDKSLSLEVNVLTTEFGSSYQISATSFPYISYSLVRQIDYLVLIGYLPRLLQQHTIPYSINIIFLTSI